MQTSSLLSKVFCYDKCTTKTYMGAFMKRKSSVLFSNSIFLICKVSGMKCIRCFIGHCAIPNSFLLYCFNINKAKCFILRLVVCDPWPVFKPQRLKESKGQLFVPKLLLQKSKSLGWLGYHPTLKETSLELRTLWSFPTGTGTCSELQLSACISKT